MGKFLNRKTSKWDDGLIKPFKFLGSHQRTYGTILYRENQRFLEDVIIKTEKW